MTYIDIDGIIEEKKIAPKKIEVKNIESNILDVKESSPSNFVKLCSVFCFLGVFTFVVVQFLNEVPELEKIITAPNAEIADINISNKVSFRSLAEIEPAAGDALDDLLEWGGEESPNVEPQKQAAPKVKSRGLVKREVRDVSLNNKKKKAEAKRVEVKKAEARKSAASNNADISKLQRSIDSLAKQVRANSISQISKSRFDTLNNNVGALVVKLTEMESEISALNNKVTILENSLADAKKSAKKQESKKTEKAVVNNPWRLRSARKGMAWVSKKGKDNLISISVGDELDIIGKVIKIGRNSKGKWYVECEKGKIYQ